MKVYFNHDEDVLPIRRFVEAACPEIVMVNDSNSSAWPSEASLAVIHGAFVQSDSDLDLDYSSLLRDPNTISTDKLLVVFVSSQPMMTESKRVVFRTPGGEEGHRYLVYTRNTVESGLALPRDGSVSEQEVERRWQELLRHLSDTSGVDAWFNNVPDRLLNKYFGERTPSGLITSIALLCQGYLIVAASVPVKFTAEDTESLAALRDAAAQIQLKDAPQRLLEVSNHKWWCQSLGLVDEQAAAEFMRRLDFEFAEIGHRNTPREVAALITATHGSADIDAETVIGAYTSIAGIMRAHEERRW